jgi:hypothetical protein
MFRATLVMNRNLSIFAFAAMTVGGVGFAANNEVASPTVERLVRVASQAKTAGDEARSFALLREAVRVAPDFGPARAQLGQIKVDDKWITIEESQRRAAADPRQAAYRSFRAQCGETPPGQLVLARWCRRNNLDEESKFHWASVLSVDPNNKEALRATGTAWHDGQLMTREEFRDSKQQSLEDRKALRRWTHAVADWMRAMSDKGTPPRTEVLDAIRAIDDRAAIPAFEIVTLDSSLSPDEKSAAPRRLSLAFIGALREMTDQPGTNSLMRYAVLSPFSDVREEAIGTLRYRPLNDYVPTLMEGLAAPIESAYQVVRDPDGSVHYRHAIYREGPFADWSHRTSRSIYGDESPGWQAAALMSDARPATLLANTASSSSSSSSFSSSSRTVSPAEARRSALRYEQEIALAEEQVAEANKRTAALNERIVAVLNGATEQNLGGEPRAWWDWWIDYTDYYRTAERPVYETQDYTNDYVVEPVAGGSCECFARGTTVWTKVGPRPIESLELGDLVLAQNVESGELKYKPVTARTVRPPSELLQFSIGREQIRSTRGHPMWVTGLGWRMAKELEEGAVLHSVAGTTRVDHVEAAGMAEAYNLVVADFNTYFVGESGILVHDNLPRKSTQATIPGIKTK